MVVMLLTYTRTILLWHLRAALLALSTMTWAQAPPAFVSPSANHFPLHRPDIMQAVQRAVQSHPAIAEAASTLTSQHAQIDAAKSGYYPQIHGGLKSGYNNTNDGLPPSHAFVLSASQTLYDFGKTASMVQTEQASVAYRQATLLLTIDQIGHQTAHTVVEIQRYQHLIDAANTQMSQLHTVAALAQERHLQGASARADVVQSAARIETAKTSLLHFQGQRERLLARLAALLGQDELGGVTDSFPQSANQACISESVDITTLPAVNLAQAQRDQARAQLAYARAQLLPTLSLDPSVTRYMNTASLPRNDMHRTQYSVFIQFTMPLYQGGSLDAKRQSAIHLLNAANANVQHAQRHARQQLMEASHQIASLQRNQYVLAERRRLSAETRDLYRQQYLALGNRALLDLLNAEQDIYQSDIEYHNSNAELRQLQLSCLYSTSTLRHTFALDDTINGYLERLP